jgi:molybdopterin converting factor small subunit
MKVELFLPPSIQYLADNIKTLEVEGNTIRECLHSLVNQYPQLKADIFTRSNKLHKGLSIYKNGGKTDVMDLDTAIKEGDKLYILNVIFGG